MQGGSREALRGSLEAYERQIASLPDGAGSAEVSQGLFAVGALLDREPSLRRALTDPASTPEARRDLVERLLGGQLSPLPLQVLQSVVTQSWSRPEDLRDGVEHIGYVAALRSAEGDGHLDDVEDELFRFARLLEREPDLRSALTDPGLPQDRKLGLIRELLTGRATAATQQIVEFAVTHPHGRSIETALEDLSRLAAERRNRYVAEVRVAVPLTEQQADRLRSSLSRMYGRDVDLQVDVDPGVVGGMQVRVGDEVLDGTVSRKLQQARRALAG